MNPYSYKNSEFRFNLRLEQTTRRWSRYTVDFPTAHPTGYKENNTVRGEYYQPRQVGQAPLAILVHGMGDYSVLPCRLLARTLVKQGIACFILYLVFHSSRMPETVRDRLPALTAEEWFESYRISVIDMRQVIDWAGGRSEINKEQVAAVGISFGGFISAIAMGVDRRLRAGVFLVAGGNSEKIMWLTRKRVIKAGYHRTESEYRHLQSSYARYLAEVAEKGFEDVDPARQSYLTDPMTFAHYLRNRPVLMLNALWDKYIPKQAALDFWEACGKPAITWFPATHTAIWLWYPVISRKIDSFLRSAFGEVG